MPVGLGVGRRIVVEQELRWRRVVAFYYIYEGHE